MAKMKELYKHAADDDMDSVQIYEQLFFADQMSPYDPKGPAELISGDANVKDSISYLDSATPIRRNMKQISNANATTGKSAIPNLAMSAMNCNSYNHIDPYNLQKYDPPDWRLIQTSMMRRPNCVVLNREMGR